MLQNKLRNSRTIPEDIPMTISASLSKQLSMPRTRSRKNDHRSNQMHPFHYSTMKSNARDYFKNSSNSFPQNIDHNSIIASTNRYRWHHESDEIALQSFRNNTIQITSNRKQHLNQINNNLNTNKTHSLDVHKTNNNLYSTDQSNGNFYPSGFRY